MRWTSWIVVLAMGCGAGGGDPKAGGETEGVDPEKAQLLINEARNQIESESFDKARELLAEAVRYSNAEIRHTVGRVTEAIDEAEAASRAKHVQSLTEQGKCEEAIALAVKVAAERADTGVVARLKQQTSEAHQACIDKVLAEGDLARARKIQSDPGTKQALDAATLAAISDGVESTVMATLEKRIAEPMKAREFKTVTNTLNEAVAKGEASPEHRAKLLKTMRTEIASEVAKIAQESFGEKGGAAALARIDELIAAGYWKARPDASGAGQQLDKDEALAMRALSSGESESSADGGPTELIPENVHRLRREMALWAGCEVLRCRESTPTKQWAYGRLGLAELHRPKDSSQRSIPHGRMVYKLAEGGGMALIALSDPGSPQDLAARAHPGAGWVAAATLKGEDTSEWLPPGDAIVGTRVWGPLRDGAKELEVGRVIGTEGGRVQVQRLSDQQVVTIERTKLHFGVTKPGTKVLAMCGSVTLAPARIEQVIEPKHESLGDPRAKLSCLDDQGNVVKSYEDPLGAVRTKLEWLPPRR